MSRAGTVGKNMSYCFPPMGGHWKPKVSRGLCDDNTESVSSEAMTPSPSPSASVQDARAYVFSLETTALSFWLLMWVQCRCRRSDAWGVSPTPQLDRRPLCSQPETSPIWIPSRNSILDFHSCLSSCFLLGPISMNPISCQFFTCQCECKSMR